MIDAIMTFGIKQGFGFDDCVKAVNRFNDDPEYYTNRPMWDLFN